LELTCIYAKEVLMIKQKKDLLQVPSPATDLQNLLVNYLKSVSLDDPERYRDARKRLEISRQISQAIKKNASTQKERQNEEVSMEAKSSKENLAGIRSQTLPSSSVANNPTDKDNLKLFLEEMADNRKKNELIYGYKVGITSQETDGKEWGIEASETAGYYKRNLGSTITRGEQGWSEFGISYDNKFFLKYSTVDSAENHQFDFNHQTMGCGTFLKAAGKIKIENEQLVISPYSQYLELGPRYVAIILFVLREKGFAFSDENCCIANEERDSISDNRLSNPKPPLNLASYYLDEKHFPLAKSIAEDKNLSIESRLSELFLSIDDEVLSARSQVLINTLDNKKTELKTDILNFLLIIINTVLNNENSQKKQMKISKGTSARYFLASEEIAYECYSKIMGSIQFFQTGHHIDLSFIKNELSSWFYYMFALSFQAESKQLADEKKEIVEELREIEKSLLKIKEEPTLLPQRFIGSDAPVSFLQFYKENPIKTCIALLCDYTKGSFFGRFFSGAWNRHHVGPVQQFLIKYKSNYFPDNLSIQDIYRELFKAQGTLAEYSGKHGTLFARLKFCAKLANEIQTENLNPGLAATSVVEISEMNRGRAQTVIIGETSTISISKNPTSNPDALIAAAASMPAAIDTPLAIHTPESSKAQRKSVVFSPPNKDELSIKDSNNSDVYFPSFDMGN
ncbi:MAG: DUF5617 domain-containing protein, partial [Rickettsiella sp.]|nr:DUF5617 domain-containing protein [Rickettsiella sp.]